METIGNFISSVFKFWFSTVLLSFIIGYTLGNYYGIKETFESPKKIELGKIPGIWILYLLDDPLANYFKK